MALFLLLGLATLVAWALWTALRPRSAFVIRIKGGVPRVARGHGHAGISPRSRRNLRPPRRERTGWSAASQRAENRSRILGEECPPAASSSCAISGLYRAGRPDLDRTSDSRRHPHDPYNRQNRHARAIRAQAVLHDSEDACTRAIERGAVPVSAPINEDGTGHNRGHPSKAPFARSVGSDASEVSRAFRPMTSWYRRRAG